MNKYNFSIDMPSTTRPLILGCEGEKLTQAEKETFSQADHSPFGLILFSRNCQNTDQLRQLIKDFRDTVKWQAPVTIDQEGGGVQRLFSDQNLTLDEIRAYFHNINGSDPLPWLPFPSITAIGELFNHRPQKGLQAAYKMGRTMGRFLRELTITINFAPVLDLLIKGSHEITTTRAFSSDAWVVASLGRNMVQGFIDEGIVPVGKHFPGHGRSTTDSHISLPRIENFDTIMQHDLYPFRYNRDIPMMLAHIVYPDYDQHPVTQSKKFIRDLIRDGLKMNNLLFTDCIYMNALSGSLTERALKCFEAGNDLIIASHGSSNASCQENHDLLHTLPPTREETIARYHRFMRKMESHQTLNSDSPKTYLESYQDMINQFE